MDSLPGAKSSLRLRRNSLRRREKFPALRHLAGRQTHTDQWVVDVSCGRRANIPCSQGIDRGQARRAAAISSGV
jgi:hypothetical protein